MTSKLHLVWLVLLAAIASLAAPSYAETRVGAFEFQEAEFTRAERVLNETCIEAYAVSSGQLAVGCPHALKGTAVSNAGGALVTRGSEVTEEVVRQAMKDAPFTSQQRAGVNLPKIQEYVDRYLAGEVAPPIKIDKGMVVDGNHRYIAGRIAGKDVPVQEWVGGRPGSAISWTDIPIDPEPWQW